MSPVWLQMWRFSFRLKKGVRDLGKHGRRPQYVRSMLTTMDRNRYMGFLM